MPIVNDRKAGLDKLDDLKAILSGPGPCLSVYVTLSSASAAGRNPNARQNELRWRECLQGLDQQVSQFGDTGRELLDSIRDWNSVLSAINAEGRPQQGRSVAVFRSPEVFQVAELDGEVADRSFSGRQFQVRPLVKELVRTRNFYLLALSQKNTRLLHCTLHTAEEVPFPAGIHTSFDAWMNQVKPDHRAVDNAMAAAAHGSVRPNALAPKGSEAEDRNEYLLHFAKHIAGGTGEALKGKTEPLVLCAVEYEIPIYREANTYPHLASEAVHGAPNGLKSGEMHARAIEALGRCYDQKVNESLAEWNHKVGGGGSSRLEDVVPAAHNGRILTLLVSDSQEAAGVFDEASNSVRTDGVGPNKEDLLNDAVVQTLLHSGKVLVVSQEKMPKGAAAAATFRF